MLPRALFSATLLLTVTDVFSLNLGQVVSGMKVTENPSPHPSQYPSPSPTPDPTVTPTTTAPSVHPTISPSDSLTASPSPMPTVPPIMAPSPRPKTEPTKSSLPTRPFISPTAYTTDPLSTPGSQEPSRKPFRQIIVNAVQSDDTKIGLNFEVELRSSGATLNEKETESFQTGATKIIRYQCDLANHGVNFNSIQVTDQDISILGTVVVVSFIVDVIVEDSALYDSSKLESDIVDCLGSNYNELISSVNGKLMTGGMSSPEDKENGSGKFPLITIFIAIGCSMLVLAGFIIVAHFVHRRGTNHNQDDQFVGPLNQRRQQKNSDVQDISTVPVHDCGIIDGEKRVLDATHQQDDSTSSSGGLDMKILSPLSRQYVIDQPLHREKNVLSEIGSYCDPEAGIDRSKLDSYADNLTAFSGSTTEDRSSKQPSSIGVTNTERFTAGQGSIDSIMTDLRSFLNEVQNIVGDDVQDQTHFDRRELDKTLAQSEDLENVISTEATESLSSDLVYGLNISSFARDETGILVGEESTKNVPRKDYGESSADNVIGEGIHHVENKDCEEIEDDGGYRRVSCEHTPCIATCTCKLLEKKSIDSDVVRSTADNKCTPNTLEEEKEHNKTGCPSTSLQWIKMLDQVLERKDASDGLSIDDLRFEDMSEALHASSPINLGSFASSSISRFSLRLAEGKRRQEV